MLDWIEISVQADGEAAEAVSELFNRLNSRPDGQGGAVTEVGGFDPIGDDHHPFVTVKTYLPADAPDTAERQRQIEEGLWYLGRIYPLGEPQVRRLAEEDWANAWKASYHPLRIGRRFLVIPAWLTNGHMCRHLEATHAADHPRPRHGVRHRAASQHAALPGRDGGRGATRPARARCGLRLRHPQHRSGAAGRGAVDAFDIDPIAVRATQENASLNDLPVAIRAVVSAGPGEGSLWHAADGSRPTWDVILVNILPHIIIGLLEAGLHTYLAPGGRMIFAGIIEEREPEVGAALAERGLTVVRRAMDGRLGVRWWRERVRAHP